MSAVFERLLERLGTNKVPRNVRPAYGFKSVVQFTNEFHRIEALERRVWEADPKLEQRVQDLTALLRAPGGTRTLWPVQAQALVEAQAYGGAFLPIGVGQGKTEISILAPVIMKAQRPILFVPAELRDQTLAYVLPLLKKHWHLHPDLLVIGYSELSLAKNAGMLDELNPDLIVLDECHRVKAKTAGRTRRLIRWLNQHPETMVVAMSGTISNRSIRDFAHIVRWCLKGKTPIPAHWTELSTWADAIDEKIPEGQRAAPGALKRFCGPGENVRQGFRRRLTETPGVVSTKENLLGVSLRIVPAQGFQVPESVEDALAEMRRTWETPNGDLITEAVEMWRHARELGLGFWYRWNPPAPAAWIAARRAWKGFTRDTLKHNRRNLDTELQVWNECSKLADLGQLDRGNPWWEWKEIKDTFEIKTVPEWMDFSAIQAAKRWLEERKWHGDAGICWVDQVAFGEMLAKISGFPFFGAGDSRILDTKEPGIIASIHAHGEGKNLERYSRNLITSPMSSGKTWEQLLGRTHRHGQDADEVIVEVVLNVEENLKSFAQARADARFLEDTTGSVQKLNYADIVIQ